MGLREEERLWVRSFQVGPEESSFPNKLIPLFQLELEAALAHCLRVSMVQLCLMSTELSLLCVHPGRLS